MLHKLTILVSQRVRLNNFSLDLIVFGYISAVDLLTTTVHNVGKAISCHTGTIAVTSRWSILVAQETQATQKSTSMYS